MNIETRVRKLEKHTSGKDDLPVMLSISSEQCGGDGEVIPQVTEEEAKQKHLADHPEDAKRKFFFINRVGVHGRWNDSIPSQLVCNVQGCKNFGKPIARYAR